MLKRDLCPTCRINPVAINYVRDGVTHYRNSCSSCIRKGKKLKPEPPAWVRSGYKKKPTCERCNFKFKLPEQSVVFHVDGNLKNNDWTNLRSVCANCRIELNNAKTTWRESPLVADY